MHLLLLPILALAAFFAEDSVQILKPSHGFALSQPVGDWQVTEAPGDQPGSLTVVFSQDSDSGMLRFSVLATPVGGLAAVALRDNAIKLVEPKPEYSHPRKVTARAAGRKAPGLDLDLELDGAHYRARLVYLVRHEMGYLLQAVVPAEKSGKTDALIRDFFDSVKLIEIDAQGTAEERFLREQAAKCGTEFRWAESWEEAARIAKQERRLILVYARLYAGFAISDDTLFGAFMDPDVVGLLDERFVALRLTKAMEIPLRSHDVYGLSGSSFGTALIVCDPDGEVVSEGFAMGAPEVHDLLIRSLEARKQATGPRPATGKDPMARAARHLRRGELSQVLDSLGDVDSREAHVLRAEVFRRQRDGESALAAIVDARTKGGDSEDALDLLEARILLGLGDQKSAQANLERFLEQNPTHDRAPEARYWLGALRLKPGSTGAAEEIWRPLALESADSRWSWRAAAILASSGLALGVGRPPAWPQQELMDALDSPGFEARSVHESAEAESDALAYLLEHQRSDGSWISPSESSGTVDPRDNQLTVAITSICARSLLPRRQQPGVEQAIPRALGWLEDARERSRKADEVAYYMDYSVYSNAYEIRFLAGALEAGIIEAQSAREAMAELVLRLEQKQRKGGGWSYYLKSDLNSTTVINQSISFITAAATIGLLRAQQAGVELPDGLLERALGCLERMRNDNHTFEYFLWHDREEAPRGTREPGAAGRGTICALALVMGAKRDLNEIRSVLKVYFEHQDELARERGKALMHCGLDGQGCHYVMFNYSNCAQAIARLPERERRPYRKALLESMLKARTSDGAFLDFPLIGRAYGAGMALIAFDALKVDRGS